MTIVTINNCDYFPAIECALSQNSPAPGLLAVSHCISANQVIQAYQKGIFPWPDSDQQILWWTPDPRMVLYTNQFRINRSFSKTINQFLGNNRCQIRVNTNFYSVIDHCANIARYKQNGTWIIPTLKGVYCQLNQQGYAHSIETWVDNRCVGGLYGVAMGHMFYGESMFSYQSNASKIALAALVAYCRQQHVELIDCQQNTPHLASLGAQEISREAFTKHLKINTSKPKLDWIFDKTILHTLL